MRAMTREEGKMDLSLTGMVQREYIRPFLLGLLSTQKTEILYAGDVLYRTNGEYARDGEYARSSAEALAMSQRDGPYVLGRSLQYTAVSIVVLTKLVGIHHEFH